MRYLKAKYVGRSEFGFVTGLYYDIKVCKREITIIPLGEVVTHLYVYDQESSAWHPYKDEEEFKRDWRIL